MERMVVTPDVLKLSGWLNPLNADVPCRGSQAIEGRVRGKLPGSGRRRATGVARSVQGRARLQIRGRARARHDGQERTENISCMLVTPDVSKLRGWLNGVCCAESCKRCWASLGPGGTHREKALRARSVCMQMRGRARRGAHREHLLHACDARRIEAQRLVERRCALPRIAMRAYGARGELREGGRQLGGSGRPRCARNAQGSGGPDCRLGRGKRAGAHIEHGLHVCDAGRIEAQRLVERRRVLPRIAMRAYGAGRASGREAHIGRRPYAHAAEHTWNMRLMSVTPEVSQLDMSALKFCSHLKR